MKDKRRYMGMTVSLWCLIVLYYFLLSLKHVFVSRRSSDTVPHQRPKQRPSSVRGKETLAQNTLLCISLSQSLQLCSSFLQMCHVLRQSKRTDAFRGAPTLIFQMSQWLQSDTDMEFPPPPDNNSANCDHGGGKTGKTQALIDWSGVVK